MNDQLTLSVLQHAPTPCDIEASLERLSTQMTEASAAGSELLIAPEASLTGYNVSPQQASTVAQSRNADSHEFLKARCLELDIGLVYGYIERDGDTLYNAVQVLSNTGDYLACYRKTHLWGDLDRSLFSAGEDLSPIVRYKGWQLGLLICYDVEFPETVRRLSLEGAELIVVPTALMEPYHFVAEHVVPTRAAESQVFIAYANYCNSENGLHYTGHSCIVSPTGEDLARATSCEQLLTVTLKRSDLESIRRNLPYLRDRRPELYTALVT